MIVHSVFFWLKNPASKSEFIAALELLATCPLIDRSYIGSPAGTLSRDVMDQSFSVSLVLHFNSEASQDTYQVHPMHEQFIKQCASLWASVKVYDSQIERSVIG